MHTHPMYYRRLLYRELVIHPRMSACRAHRFPVKVSKLEVCEMDPPEKSYILNPGEL
jgi:hypothetical protein